MNILVIGSGGREHAIVQALKRSPLVHNIFIYPGNDGIRLDAIDLEPKSPHILDLVKRAGDLSIELVVVGPEVELVKGYSDEFRAAGFLVYGPSQQAAQLEGSKIFAKDFMNEFSIPTALSVVVESTAATLTAAKKFKPPYVLKADGLAAGKGVYICDSLEELKIAAEGLFDHRILGDAGSRALLEEFQPGEEVSALAITNGEKYELLPLSRDHKRLLDNDKGPNTGGMGVICPVSLEKGLLAKIQKAIIEPTLRGIKQKGLLFRGTLFIGLMLTKDGPKVLEYNVRFGDPETQAVLPLLDGDWAQVFKQVAEGSLPNLKWQDHATACVVLAAEGYPEQPVKGVAISGLESSESNGDVQILHAGTKKNSSGQFVTNGGRVLNVVVKSDKIDSAISKAYQYTKIINWPGMHFRTDIGIRNSSENR